MLLLELYKRKRFSSVKVDYFCIVGKTFSDHDYD